MNELHLRPRTVTELVDAAFTLYRRHPIPYVTASAIAIAPSIAVGLLMNPFSTPTSVEMGALWIVQGVSWLSYALASALIAKLGSDAYLGGEPDVGVAVRHVAPRVPAVLISSVLKLPLYVLGGFALGVGALYVATRFFAVGTVVVLEGRSPIEAFGRSTQLSQGRKRHILNTLLLIFVIWMLFTFGIGALFAMFESFVLTQIMSTMLTLVAYPLVGLTTLMLYYDARIRGEGFDLEQMAGALDTPAVTA
jgi:hypothetical protein